MKLTTMLLLTAAAINAAPILISLDTTPLSGTYYLDFQLSGTDAVYGTNSVTLANLDLGGGTFGAADLTNASGSFPDYTITDAGFFNQVLIEFVPGKTVSFGLTFTNNFSGQGTPDTFTATVLDESMSSIVSTGLGALLQVNLDGSAAPVIRTFAADPEFGSIEPAVLAEAGVPEPNAWGLVLAGLVVVLALAKSAHVRTGVR